VKEKLYKLCHLLSKKNKIYTENKYIYNTFGKTEIPVDIEIFNSLYEEQVKSLLKDLNLIPFINEYGLTCSLLKRKTCNLLLPVISFIEQIEEIGRLDKDKEDEWI